MKFMAFGPCAFGKSEPAAASTAKKGMDMVFSSSLIHGSADVVWFGRARFHEGNSERAKWGLVEQPLHLGADEFKVYDHTSLAIQRNRQSLFALLGPEKG